jgi:hypothetical protein
VLSTRCQTRSRIQPGLRPSSGRPGEEEWKVDDWVDAIYKTYDVARPSLPDAARMDKERARAETVPPTEMFVHYLYVSSDFGQDVTTSHRPRMSGPARRQTLAEAAICPTEGALVIRL